MGGNGICDNNILSSAADLHISDALEIISNFITNHKSKLDLNKEIGSGDTPEDENMGVREIIWFMNNLRWRLEAATEAQNAERVRIREFVSVVMTGTNMKKG